MRYLICSVLLFSAVITPAFADDTAGELRQQCLSAIQLADNMADHAASQFDAGMCIGILDATMVIALETRDWWKKDLQICLPDGYRPTRNQYARIFVEYMDDHPKDWQEVDIVMVVRAFRDAWPCSGR